MRSITILFFITFFSNIVCAQRNGCTDQQAKNYDSKADRNDGSCVYSKNKIKPDFSVTLSDAVHESSGLLYWKNKLWTMNDDGDTHLYSFDSLGKKVQKLAITKVRNTDWEAIAQDSAYIYIGDLGNNVNGNRKDLHILKIEKNALLQNKTVVDTISFSFEKQFSFENQKANTTDFDCETLLVTRDSIYLVTKEWSSKKASLHVLPKTKGEHQAKFKAEFNVKGLITGGVILEDQKIIALSGYSKMLKPFVYLLYDYNGNDFFSGNKRKIKLALPFHQVEGIATKDGLHYYLTNEAFQRKPLISVPQKLHSIDLSDYLKSYLLKTVRNH
ncbi:T9SS C-terminal target domain-containing protein [Flavobacterium sp.]|jgi:hypothetical protein|uniref:T9SS C-terminal target domain-containing protein n=1 Tax=Flavobacterium sp. TaxID=239 RepID=UPI0037BE4F1D